MSIYWQNVLRQLTFLARMVSTSSFRAYSVYDKPKYVDYVNPNNTALKGPVRQSKS